MVDLGKRAKVIWAKPAHHNPTDKNDNRAGISLFSRPKRPGNWIIARLITSRIVLPIYPYENPLAETASCSCSGAISGK
ncbi:hypothetical protein D3C86_1877480 [compost metagenome]